MADEEPTFRKASQGQLGMSVLRCPNWNRQRIPSRTGQQNTKGIRIVMDAPW